MPEHLMLMSREAATPLLMTLWMKRLRTAWMKMSQDE